MYIADTLSRAYTPNDAGSSSHKDDEFRRIHIITDRYPATKERLEIMRVETLRDRTLVKLRARLRHGWPAHKSSTHPDLQPFWPFRDEIHVENDLLFWGERLIIPRSQRKELLLKLHEGHPGASKCKARASLSMYWPNMGQDIEDTVAACPTCATYTQNDSKEPMVPHEVPHRPWSKIGGDIFEFGGKSYLVIVDYYSKYPEVVQLVSKTAQEVITKLKAVFARYGIPDAFVSDNMPFGSSAFVTFAQEWGFETITSSPTYPQSNGQSERFVNIMKTIFKKAHATGEDPHAALLQYRNTPISGLQYSPAQLLMGRRRRGPPPTTIRQSSNTRGLS